MSLGAYATEIRTGEMGKTPFRSNRFFCVGHKWYFTTREGFDSGPYADRTRAKLGLDRFLHIVSLLPMVSQAH